MEVEIRVIQGKQEGRAGKEETRKEGEWKVEETGCAGQGTPEAAGIPFAGLSPKEQEAVGQALKKRFFASLGYVPKE